MGGMVVGLDYSNPYLSPYQEFQRFKQHPRVKALLEGGQCISYGARCLNEGGLQAIPKLTFPGGMLAGCSAGFLNVPKVKGSHNAMNAGMLPGLAYGGATLIGTRGKEPWTFRWSKKDSEYTKEASKCKKIEYPKADGVHTFDILDNLIRSSVNHEHDQPAHLRVKEDKSAVPLEVSLQD